LYVTMCTHIFLLTCNVTLYVTMCSHIFLLTWNLTLYSHIWCHNVLATQNVTDGRRNLGDYVTGGSDVRKYDG